MDQIIIKLFSSTKIHTATARAGMGVSCFAVYFVDRAVGLNGTVTLPLWIPSLIKQEIYERGGYVTTQKNNLCTF